MGSEFDAVTVTLETKPSLENGQNVVFSWTI